MTNPLRPISQLASGQLIVGAVGTLAGLRWGGVPVALSFLSGAVMILASVLTLAWVGWRVFAQKSVAWTVVAIISKYALFLSSIYYLTRSTWFNLGACGLGISSFVIAALIGAITTGEKESLRGGSTF